MYDQSTLAAGHHRRKASEYATEMHSCLIEKLPDLRVALRQLLSQVPPGRVTTYGRLAQSLGDVVASRWVGEYLRHHPHHSQCPCHRVVRFDGSLGIHVSGDPHQKASLLEREGVRVTKLRVELEEYLFEAFVSERPLQQLAKFQTELAHSVELMNLAYPPRLIGGVDVSYGRDGRATSACTLVDVSTGELVWHATCSRRVEFPYISTYLAFRELPLLVDGLQLAWDAGHLPDIVMVDGSGVLHPRRCGVAAMLGVAADIATIGVTKKLLCGHYDRGVLKSCRSAPIELDGKEIGKAMLPRAGTAKPLFVSPGHRVDVATAFDVVTGTLGHHRLPEPIYWADRFSRESSRAVFLK